MNLAGRHLAAAMIGLGMGFAFPVAQAEEAGAATVTRDLAVVTTVKADLTPVVARVPVTGSLVARDPVQVHANIAGYQIREIQAEIGDSVRAGDVLLKLDEDALSVQLAQAEAEYRRAEAAVKQAESQITSAEAMLTQAASALERTRSLRRSGSAAQAALDDAIATEASARASAASATDGLRVAQAQLAQAEAARRIAELNLGYSRVVAPVDGIIVGRNAEIGAMSSAGGEPLFSMVARGEIELAADIIETALVQIRPGDSAELSAAGLGGISGEVRLVPASVDPETRLGEARISIDADPRLKIGLFASGWIVTDRREALTVPAMAVLSEAEGDRVQVVKDGRVETRPVVAGLVWNGRREILEGLSAGEEVVARAGAFFRTGDEVRAVLQPETRPEQAVSP
ncbi:efflux RND transporter periplasmic adaptor subunit [Paracoccus sp. MBLB3053]|uniref:Efflux RND transporter periplasmic adaptor subunit n=1 Tax=Paracoccus aurantius TaxID=3073814 RepID=A0ABU2HSB7_9RHOB|nr:efflux RND transporter periplasmic adaptor subunit [Paracoccus sp. MBLB3053]MDS9467514.1 efflux RND transporter periplasmic adaptor subunit [Paracoccus sp. MBLB3053]